MNFTFFGTDNFSVAVLDELKSAAKIPSLIITAPDRPAGRGQKTKQSNVKKWALENKIEVLQPEKLDTDFVSALTEKAKKFSSSQWDFFVVASYGKIVPQSVLDLPKYGALNVHPSLLPEYRGASPIESAILDDNKNTGVTIMLMDEKMDHGPILNQEFVYFDEWENREIIESRLASVGGGMLAETIESWIGGDIEPQEQDHDTATFTKKISKNDGLIDFEDIKKIVSLEKDESQKKLSLEKQRTIFLKIKALSPWPGAHFFIKRGGEDLRVKITDAEWANNRLEITNVVPAGRKPMSWNSFIDGFLRN